MDTAEGVESESEDEFESIEATREAFNLEAEGCKLACWEPPLRVPNLGWLVRLSLFDRETYRGPAVDVVLGPDGASLDDLRATALEAVNGLVEHGLRAALRDDGARLAEILGLPPLDLDDPDTARRLGDDPEGRRDAALAVCERRFPAVAAKLQALYGLQAPRHLITWAAFARSLGPLARRGLDFLGRSPGGIMIWFEDDGLDREPREGLDPRLDCRFRRDPPELVTVAWGDSDGLHYGLWYDDPRRLPTALVANYARDSAETWDTGQPSMLAVLQAQLRERMRDDPREFVRADVLALQGALAYFMPFEAALREDEGAGNRDLPGREGDEPQPRPRIVGGMGPALLVRHGEPRGSHAEEQARYAAYQAEDPQVEVWIRQARAELEAGEPAFALVLGRELHWLDADAYREVGLELLVTAYRALGRDALAEIAAVHHAHRDLPSVAVY